MTVYRPTSSVALTLLLCSVALAAAVGCDPKTEDSEKETTETEDTSVPFSALGAISGVVVDLQGTPIPDATVVTAPETSTLTTDAAGVFSLTELPIGAYAVTVTCDGYVEGSDMVGVADDTTTAVEVILIAVAGDDTVGAITGTVLDTAGVPVEGAEVSVDGSTTLVDTTGADGAFSITAVDPGSVFLSVTAPSTAYLDGELRRAQVVEAGAVTDAGTINLSGRPSDTAQWVGGAGCVACHNGLNPEKMAGLEATAHARFVTAGTSHMVYPDLWPEPYDAGSPRETRVVPVSSSGTTLMVQDPRDADGTVNLVLCTDDSSGDRQFLFEFYPEGSYEDADLDCSHLDDPDYVVIPVIGTVGGEGNWGEGYLDPDHEIEDTVPNYGEGKQRFWCDPMAVPFLAEFYAAQGFSPDDFAKQDYQLMPVYLVQDGTREGSEALSSADWGAPKFWQKNPTTWVNPTAITMARNCAGCHNTGLDITYEDISYNGVDYKSVITSYDYLDLNITCERCHGPGSDHATSSDPTKIINPGLLNTEAANQACGQCHAAHSGLSLEPYGIFKYSYDATYEGELGDGTFVPGVHDLSTFVRGYDTSTKADSEGCFDSWGDETHSHSHSQMLPEMIRSVHYDNDTMRLTCFDCHDAHGLSAGPPALQVENFEYQDLAWANNGLCLACHAGQGSFAELSKLDVAQLHELSGGVALQDGAAPTYTDSESVLMNRIAHVVGDHMQQKAGMGSAPYTPADPAAPVGSCTSCHMAKIGKLKDTNDDAQYHLAYDSNGMIAVAEGNVPSHVFDIVWPGQSSVTISDDLSTGHDYDVMPNSCGACHDFARFSGDLD